MIKQLILYLLLTTAFVSFSQTKSNVQNGEAKSMVCAENRPDTMQNWNYDITKICVDPSFKTKEKIKIKNNEYNYVRTYSKGRKRIIYEYGNLDSTNVANGHWAYCTDPKSPWLEGEMENGYKKDKWVTVLCYDSYIIYAWNKERTATKLKHRYCSKE